MVLGRIAAHACAIAGYVAVALVFNWPLPVRLGTHFTGSIGGDTGVYVWNLWLFRHEIVAHGRVPLFTGEIFALSPPVDLSLHNYTLFADLLAFPLIPVLGVPVTFNVIYLGLVVLSAWTMFLLARAVIGRDGEAWLAGLLFACSPFFAARSTAHFSLVAAAPLPVFLLLLIRAEQRWDARYAIGAGLTAAWAAMCDPYYGVFCVLLAAAYVTAKFVHVHMLDGAAPPVILRRAVDALLLFIVAVIVTILATGGTDVRLFRATIRLRTLYTPVLLLTLLTLARVWIVWPSRFAIDPMPRARVALRFVLTAGLACVLPLGPTLYALSHRLRDGGVLHHRILWRSSPRGMDLLALFSPNPSHKWFGDPWRDWLTSLPGGYEENAASLTVVGILAVALAVFRYRFRPPPTIVGLLAFFGLIALGPFIRVAGFNTYIPTPWLLLRYVPIISATRMPGRYAVVVMMLFSLLFGLALAHIANQWRWRRVLLALVGVALAAELAPLPRRLYSAAMPEIYRMIASDPRDIRVLELPFGIRDGEWSEGDYTAAAQFYQTVHEKALIGGYLSRVSDAEVRRQHALPTISRLMRLSEGRSDDPLPADEIQRRADRFLRLSRLGYVIMDARRTPPKLRRFAIDMFRLSKIAESDGRELYAVPGLAPGVKE